MKESNYSFLDGFYMNKPVKRKVNMAFDWDKAAQIIKDHFELHKDLIAEAGLQGDWAYTGGEIFIDGKPTNDEYTYLSSHWAEPTLILSWDGCEQMTIPCFTDQTERFNSDTKWDEQSLSILGINL